MPHTESQTGIRFEGFPSIWQMMKSLQFPYNKIMSIIGEIFMIGWVTIVLITWFTGE